MRQIGLIAAGVVAALVVVVLSGTLFIVDETEQVVITQFGSPVGEPITEPGLKWKLPFIQVANRFEKRFLEWDGVSNEFPTKDKRFIYVDTYARWQIVDPLRYLQRLGNEASAQSRLRAILDGATRSTIASHDLIEVVRSSNREFTVADELIPEMTDGEADGEGIIDVETPTAAPRSFKQIEFGRAELQKAALESAREGTASLGIEILDLRFKRISYTAAVQRDVYDRMISERKRIAARFRSEGEGKSAEINGERERELQTIRSEAYREAETIKGRADAEAARIYAEAYSQDPEFYEFVKSMGVLSNTLRDDAVVVLDTGSELLRYLKRAK